MTAAYQETLDGELFERSAPGPQHELICFGLHALTGARLLSARSKIVLSKTTSVCPDLALVTAATGKLWLVAKTVSSDDHRTDTVIKKEIFEEMKLPRLWMIDPRYDNVEVYHGSEYGLALKSILAGREVLTEKLLPDFRLIIEELFAVQNGKSVNLSRSFCKCPRVKVKGRFTKANQEYFFGQQICF